jgi:transposase-like protein
MQEGSDQTELFKGIVQVDDYYFGGDVRAEDRGPGKRGRGTKKQPIVGAIESETGKLRTEVVPNLKADTIISTVGTWVDPEQTELHSDE